MTVLIAYATAHGSTRGVAERIAGRLGEAGFAATVAPVDEAPDVGQHEAVVVGSALHSQAWLPEARRFVDANVEQLAQRPTWLFTVGTIGETSSFLPRPIARLGSRLRKDSAELAGWRSAIGVRDHRYFAGAISPDHWSPVGNVVLRLLGGRHGDHRDWDDIDAWSDRIAAGLRGRADADRVPDNPG